MSGAVGGVLRVWEYILYFTCKVEFGAFLGAKLRMVASDCIAGAAESYIGCIMKRRSHCLLVAAIIFVFSAAGWGMSVEHMGVKPLWRAAVISDTQTDQREWMVALFNQLRDAEPDMVLHIGDTHFDWSGAFALRALACLLRSKPGGLEFHLAPGNHDMDGGLVKSHLRRAAIEGLFRSDRGITFKGPEYALKRVSAFVPNPILPAWNPEIADHPAWQVGMTTRVLKKEYPDVVGSRSVFKGGWIRVFV